MKREEIKFSFSIDGLDELEGDYDSLLGMIQILNCSTSLSNSDLGENARMLRIPADYWWETSLKYWLDKFAAYVGQLIKHAELAKRYDMDYNQNTEAKHAHGNDLLNPWEQEHFGLASKIFDSNQWAIRKRVRFGIVGHCKRYLLDSNAVSVLRSP